MLGRRTLIQRITVVVGAGVVVASAPPAVARERTTHPTPPVGNVIDVVGTSTGFTMPERHSAGFVTFDVSTTHAQGGLFALWKLGPATTLGEALRYALMGLSDTRRLSITSHHSGARPPVASATAVFTLAGRRAAYRMPTRLPGGRPLRMVNAMPQLTEAMFMPVRPDTTREQPRRFT